MARYIRIDVFEAPRNEETNVPMVNLDSLTPLSGIFAWIDPADMDLLSEDFHENYIKPGLTMIQNTLHAAANPSDQDVWLAAIKESNQEAAEAIIKERV